MFRKAWLLAALFGFIPLLVVVSSEPTPPIKLHLDFDHSKKLHNDPAPSEPEMISLIRSGMDLDSKESNAEFQEILGDLFQEEPLDMYGQDLNSEPHAAEIEDFELIQQLRFTGELLDQKANRLEHERQYQGADRLRRLSNRVRQTARDFDVQEASVQEANVHETEAEVSLAPAKPQSTIAEQK